ncbi:MAG: PEP-CTERM sorting domain-containing protein [Myxococcota bacterium]
MASLALCFALPSQATALSVLDFNLTVPNTGVIDYATAGGTLKGSGIEIANVVSIQSPSHQGETLSCVNCILSFETGVLNSYIPGPVIDTWIFEEGSSTHLTIEGSIPASGSISPPDLMHAVFSTQIFVVRRFVTGFTVQIGIYEGEAEDNLASYFGESETEIEQGGMNISFHAPSVATDGTFTSSTLYSGNLTANVVPEPGTELLLLVGLAGLGYAGRREK